MCIDKVVPVYDFGYEFSNFHADYTFCHILQNDIHTVFLRCVTAYVSATYNLPNIYGLKLKLLYIKVYRVYLERLSISRAAVP